MKILHRLHLDKCVLFLCSVLGIALILTYHKMLYDEGLLQHRRYKEQELFSILDSQQHNQESQGDTVSKVDKWRETGVRSSLSRRSIRRSYDENEEQIVTDRVVSNKYLIYLCNRQKLCGDWASRQAAIVSTYILANLTNRIFKVSMTSPCRLQQFLIPKEYNWIPNIDELRGKPFKVISDDRNSTFLEILKSRDFNSVYWHDTVFIRATTDFGPLIKQNPYYKDRVPRWMLQSNKMVLKTAWNMLMTPSAHIENILNHIIIKNGLPGFRELTCVYVKTTDTTSSHSGHKDFIFKFLEPIAGKAKKVFVATDSEEFRNMSRIKLGDKCLDSGGVLMDIDKDRGFVETCQALETLILDQLILTQCYVLVISKSSFGETTAVLRATNTNLFSLGEGTIHQETIFQEYQANKHQEKSTQLQQYYEHIMTKTQTELTTLKSHLKAAKKDVDTMKKKHNELAERLGERSRQYQKLQTLYESLRRRCITPASFNGTGDASQVEQTVNRLQNFTMALTTGEGLRGQTGSVYSGSRPPSPPERDFVFRPNNTPILAEQSRFNMSLGTPK